MFPAARRPACGSNTGFFPTGWSFNRGFFFTPSSFPRGKFWKSRFALPCSADAKDSPGASSSTIRICAATSWSGEKPASGNGSPSRRTGRMNSFASANPSCLVGARRSRLNGPMPFLWRFPHLIQQFRGVIEQRLPYLPAFGRKLCDAGIASTGSLWKGKEKYGQENQDKRRR